MIISEKAKAELRKILEAKQIFLAEEELQKCGLFLLTLLANSLKIN